MSGKPTELVVDVHEFKKRLCEYMRRLQAGEIDLMIQRYRKPVAIVLSTYQSKLRREATDASNRLRLHLFTEKRFDTERRRIRINALKHWPNTKFALLRSGGGGEGTR